MIHQHLVQHIIAIKRIGLRIMSITLRNEKAITPLTIIKTYAPEKVTRQQKGTNNGVKLGKRYNKSQKSIWGSGVQTLTDN